MANRGYNNLISLADRPEDERKEIARLGGYAKAQKERRARTVRDTLKTMLDSAEYSSPTVLFDDGFDYEMVLSAEATVQDVICAGLIEQAMNGNLRACEIIFKAIAEL